MSIGVGVLFRILYYVCKLLRIKCHALMLLLSITRNYEGDPRSNANTSVISSTFGISKTGFHVYYDILSIFEI